MKHGLTFLFLFFVTLDIYSQTILAKDSFYRQQTSFPSDYKTIVGDPKGWRAVGHYNLDNGKIDYKLSSWDTLSIYTPFRDGSMYTKIRGKKIIGKGDRKAVYKIKYVDNSTMILDYKGTAWVKNKKTKFHTRTLYRRRT